MPQLSVPFAEKLDAQLADLCNDHRGLAPSARVPVIVRCMPDEIPAVDSLVQTLGGTIRHHLRLIGAIAAWVPLSALEALAVDSEVQHIELAQSFLAA